MKFSPITLDDDTFNTLKDGIVQGVDLVSIESFVSTAIKKYTQHYIFSRVFSGILYTFIIEAFVTGSRCETMVTVSKFNRSLRKDGSFVMYSVGNNLLWTIDTEDNDLYYLYDLAAVALNQSMKDIPGDIS